MRGHILRSCANWQGALAMRRKANGRKTRAKCILFFLHACKVVLWLRWIVAGLSLLEARIRSQATPRGIYVEQNEWHSDKAFSGYFYLSPHYHCTNTPYSSPTLCTLSNWQRRYATHFKDKWIWHSWIKRDQLDVTCFIISLFNAQHVSDVNTSILRSSRLICWVISWVVLLWFDVCWCYVVVWLWWCGICMQTEELLPQLAYGYHTTTVKPQHNTNTHRTRAKQPMK